MSNTEIWFDETPEDRAEINAERALIAAEERALAAEAKLAKIREIIDKARERHLDIISIRTEDLVRILNEERQP